ncbi:MAG: UDP-3-O-[3-hydroxymyristoyl] N-acetylglucosamine deacetylase [Gluconacetobacter diazotrophicus]|nr:UDP-3-O-[3-hydroxymyristoyl] N-acetylglucosamine deacetylase [Gluconacetobacter diazotrophicus]
MQSTLARTVSCSGVGLHSGQHTTVVLHPAPAGAGITFHRTDTGASVPALWDRVCATTLCTALGSAAPPGGGREPVVGTVEHLMAALAAARIDNLRIELDGPEIPILDGSAAAWMLLIDCAGRRQQHAPRRSIRVTRTVRVQHGDSWAQLDPGGHALSVSLGIDFASGAVGAQRVAFDGSERDFRGELAVARTFTFLGEVEAMRAAGLARGGSLDNAVVVDGDAVLNPGGNRYVDECVRHKALDVVGDLALAGAPIIGRFSGHRTGHRLNNQLLHALFADAAAWTVSGIPRHAVSHRRAA